MKLSEQAVAIATTFTLAGLLASAITTASAQAQTQPSRQPPDSVVAVVADAMSLPFVPPDQLPVFGTFWEVRSSLPCLTAPLPFPPLDTNTPVYAIGDPIVGGQFLVDETAGQVISPQAQSGRRAFRSMSTASILQAQVDELQAFVAQVQAAQTNAQLGAAGQMSRLTQEGGGILGPMPNTPFTADDLGLTLVTVTNATGFFIVHPPDAEATTEVYDLFMTTNLSANVPGLNLTHWLWILRTEPGETNLIVPDLWVDQAYFMLGRTNDTDGDGMSDAYEHLVSHTSPTNQDGPIITSQPLSQTIYSRDTVTFSVTAIGPQPLTYQWMFNATAIPGETNTSLTFLNAQGGQAGDYSVQVSSPFGLPTLSSNATLTVYGSGWPFIPVVGPRQDYTFKRAATYLIFSPVELYGRTVIQGGSTIKFDTATNSTLQVKGALVTEATAYYPAMLTRIEDDSVGSPIWGGPASLEASTNACAYLDLSSAQPEASSISNLHVAYADQALTTPVASGRLDIWHCQFVQCGSAVAPGQNASVGFHNVLLAHCLAAVAASTNFTGIDAEHLTADLTDLWVGPSAPGRVCLTNSIVFGAIAGGSSSSYQCVAINPSPTNLQASAGGHYYLSATSPLRGTGTTNITPSLLASLRRKTTTAPVALPPFAAISGAVALSPQAPRYAGGLPDLGYWYDPLDVTIGSLTLQQEGSISALPGTAIGLRNDYNGYPWAYLLDMQEGSSFISHGTPDHPNTIAPIHYIQEGPFTNTWAIAFIPDFWPNENNQPPPILDFRFTDIFLPAEDFLLFSGLSWEMLYGTSLSSTMQWSLRDCNLHGGSIMLGTPGLGDPDSLYGPGSLSWFNSLFDRVNITLDPTYYADNGVANIDLQFHAYNNVFRDQLFLINPLPTSGGNWTLKDNLFDKMAFFPYWVGPLDHDHNAYWPRLPSELTASYHTNSLPVNNDDGGTDAVNDQILAVAPPYLRGPLGDCYLPIATPLYHAGSRPPVDAGLFHYTTRVDQVKEGDETGNHAVSIGLHYIATAAATNSLPVDADGDGIPDYAEDANGNGQQDEAETAWLTPDAPTPTVGGTIGLTSANQVLTGPITITATVFASPSNNVANVELLDMDLSSGQTAILGSIDVDAPSTNIAFDIESSNLRNGWHLLQLRVTDDNGGDHFSGTTPNTSLSSPLVAKSQNDIYLLNEDSLSVGWMWHLEFGSTIQDGTWRINMYDDTGALWKSFDGDIASSLTANGTIQVSDWFTDDGNGGQRARTSADEYPGEYFDVAVVATAAAGGQTPPPNSIKYIRTRIAHRPNSRVSCVVEAPMINRTGLRSIIDPMMDASYVGLAPLSRHFYVSRMASAADQSPSAMGWNYCDTPQLWTNLNKFLAGSVGDKCTHLFALAHGDKTGFGQRVWSLGPGDHVSRATLDAFGYSYFTNISVTITGPPPATGTFTARIVVRQTGLTFAFIDGCNAAGFLWNLALDPMNIRHPTLQDLINAGRFPYYGCSWTKCKQVAPFGPGGFANDILWQHSDYVARFFEFAMDIDQNTGLPKWNYRQAREKAKYYSNSPNTVNPWSGGWDHEGCDELYIDE